MTEVKDNDKALQCEICDRWFHIKCEKMPSNVYDDMVNKEAGQQLHWNCAACKHGHEKLFQYLNKIETQQVEPAKTLYEMKETSDKKTKPIVYALSSVKVIIQEEISAKKNFDKRLENIEAKLSNLEHAQNSSLNCTTSEPAIKSLTGSHLPTGTVSDVIKEMEERRARENNVVIYGIEEFDSNNSNEKNQHDNTTVKEILQVCNTPPDSVVTTRRLGRYNPEMRKRPILVVLDDARKKGQKNVKNLPTIQKFSQVIISNDLTKQQRLEDTTLRNKAKNLTSVKGEKRVVRGPPWARRIVKIGTPGNQTVTS